MKFFRKKQKENTDRSKFLSRLASVKLLNRLDRYLIGKFLGTYFFSIVLIISIAIVFDYNENIDKFTTNNAPLKGIVFDYYLNFVPYYSNLFSPLFVFISVIFFTSKLAENSEIIAMMSTGMSFERLMRPYMISAAIIALITFGLGAYVIPKGSEIRLNFENVYKKKQRADFIQNVQLQVDTGVIAFIEHFDGATKIGYRFSLDKFENKKLVSHLTASTVRYDTLSDEKYHWIISNFTYRAMNGMPERLTSGTKIASLIMTEPSDFLVATDQQEILTNPELKEFIEKQKLRGLGNVKPFEVEYYKRFATPFASFILTTIGLSLSARKRKGGMGVYLGIGLGLSASYILFQTISATLAINADWPSVLAVWLPNILFTIIAFFLYKKAPR